MNHENQFCRILVWSILYIFIGAVLAVFSSQTVIADLFDDNIDQLSQEQALLADRMIIFSGRMEEKHFAIIEQLNGQLDIERLPLEHGTADFDVKVIRGDVIEKAVFMTSMIKKAIPPYFRDTVWNRYIKIDIYPKSPLIGLLHITLNFTLMKDGTSALGGWMDIVPAAWIEDDFDILRNKMDDIFSAYDVDVAPYRELVCVGDPEEIDREWRRRPACTGASFYLPPPLAATERNFDFITEAFEGMFDTYYEILDQRRDQAYTAEQMASQDAMRKTWLEDGLFSDPVVSNLIPREVWLLSNTPPNVKF